MKSLLRILPVALLLCCSTSAQAVFLDPYDNVLFPDGFYTSIYGNFYSAGKRTDSQGDESNADFTVLTSTVRASYYKKILDIPTVFQVGIPFGEIREKSGGALKERSSGLADIWFGPGVFLYSNEKTQTHISYWFYAYAPTGQFNKNNTYANLGWNHWYFENQLAVAQGYGNFIFDMLLNHYIHTRERDLIETPDRLELDTSLGYQVTPKFLVGLNLGGHWDLGDYKQGGTTFKNSGAERYEFGPVLAYTFTDKFSATLRWNYDMFSRNDTKGNDFWVRISYAF